ncbi:MAG TPA: hypothetical protein VMG10_06430, partial [Gemmataceae bacterium]|nr:hypothetical protein [Gemmataceae bacterium]
MCERPGTRHDPWRNWASASTQRLTQVLQGKVATVVRGLRRLGSKQKLCAAKRKVLTRICGYLHKNR